jgi:hypothetical protein
VFIYLSNPLSYKTERFCIKLSQVYVSILKPADCYLRSIILLYHLEWQNFCLNVLR